MPFNVLRHCALCSEVRHSASFAATNVPSSMLEPYAKYQISSKGRLLRTGSCRR
jgi:hypothetical protein